MSLKDRGDGYCFTTALPLFRRVFSVTDPHEQSSRKKSVRVYGTTFTKFKAQIINIVLSIF